MAVVILFLSLGGFFHLSVLRLAMHRHEQRSLPFSDSGRTLRLNQKQYVELVQGHDELQIGTTWYDVRSVEVLLGEVVVHLHQDTAESYWRELLVDSFGHSPHKSATVLFLFYYISSQDHFSGSSPFFDVIPGQPVPSIAPAITVGLLRPPCCFNTLC